MDRQGSNFSDLAEDSSARLENLEAQTIMRREVYGPHDALDLLYKAATDHHPTDHHPPAHTRQESVSSAAQPSRPRAASHVTPREVTTNGRPAGRTEARSVEPIDPRLLPSADTKEAEKEALEKRLDVRHEDGYEDALRFWGRFRFVRAGWFTREEAVKYIT